MNNFSFSCSVFKLLQTHKNKSMFGKELNPSNIVLNFNSQDEGYENVLGVGEKAGKQ